MPVGVSRRNLLWRSIGRNLKSRRSRGNSKGFVAAGRNTSKDRFSPVRRIMRKDSGKTLILLKSTTRGRR